MRLPCTESKSKATRSEVCKPCKKLARLVLNTCRRMEDERWRTTLNWTWSFLNLILHEETCRIFHTYAYESTEILYLVRVWRSAASTCVSLGSRIRLSLARFTARIMSFIYSVFYSHYGDGMRNMSSKRNVGEEGLGCVEVDIISAQREVESC